MVCGFLANITRIKSEKWHNVILLKLLSTDQGRIKAFSFIDNFQSYQNQFGSKTYCTRLLIDQLQNLLENNNKTNMIEYVLYIL